MWIRSRKAEEVFKDLNDATRRLCLWPLTSSVLQLLVSFSSLWASLNVSVSFPTDAVHRRSERGGPAADGGGEVAPSAGGERTEHPEGGHAHVQWHGTVRGVVLPPLTFSLLPPIIMFPSRRSFLCRTRRDLKFYLLCCRSFLIHSFISFLLFYPQNTTSSSLSWLPPPQMSCFWSYSYRQDRQSGIYFTHMTTHTHTNTHTWPHTHLLVLPSISEPATHHHHHRHRHGRPVGFESLCCFLSANCWVKHTRREQDALYLYFPVFPSMPRCIYKLFCISPCLHSCPAEVLVQTSVTAPSLCVR